MMQPEWGRRPNNRPYRHVRAMRDAALDKLSAAPDFCYWQDRSEMHISVYCLLNEALDEIRIILEDSRFDLIDLCEDEPKVLHLYKQVFRVVDELFREYEEITATWSKNAVIKKMTAYTNWYVKHRADKTNAEDQECAKRRVYLRDNHKPRKLVDFLADPGEVREFGIHTNDCGDTVWGVPSLVAVVGHVVNFCKNLDQRLREDPDFLKTLERRYAEYLEPQAV